MIWAVFPRSDCKMSSVLSVRAGDSAISARSALRNRSRINVSLHDHVNLSAQARDTFSEVYPRPVSVCNGIECSRVFYFLFGCFVHFFLSGARCHTMRGCMRCNTAAGADTFAERQG